MKRVLWAAAVVIGLGAFASPALAHCHRHKVKVCLDCLPPPPCGVCVKAVAVPVPPPCVTIEAAPPCAPPPCCAPAPRCGITIKTRHFSLTIGR